MLERYFKQIADELDIRPDQVVNTAALLNDGATIPFISRYRKEFTDNLDEQAITRIRDRLGQLEAIEKRRDAIIKSIEQQGKLTEELKNRLMEATALTELEDIYLPYRPKKKTRATIARAKGLEPLARIIMSQKYDDIQSRASSFVDKEKSVNDLEEALQGARDIIAEWINEHQYARSRLRKLYQRDAVISSHVIRGREQEGIKYKTYFEWEEKLTRAPSHRILAMLRGENEGVLGVRVMPSAEKAAEILEGIFIKGHNESARQVQLAIQDSYKRLLHPSMETEMKSMAKEKADEKAIEVFVENLRQLLLAPPLGQKNVLAIDPGFRTGCKLVCLDRQGNLQHNETIFPHPPQNEVAQSIKKVLSLVDAYRIEAIAIGNGTAGRQTEKFIKSIKFKRDILAIMVNESGASVYSASPVAREEFPDYDVTVRGAVSIGRRLMDPLAELVKIDPKSIGVGQYQHDIDQKLLAKSLEDTVISCVNRVGVEVNSSSKQLLSFVSGVGPALAQNIIDYRRQHGPFKSREELKEVSRFGPKVFEQAIGFLRIHDAENPLDRSAVHPESYPVVVAMARSVGSDVSALMKDVELRKKIDLRQFISDKAGLPTLEDIMDELDKPGRDPREKFDVFEFEKGVNTIEDLRQGMVLPGIITNITAFGAFVDIGVHQDGLVHISQMADRFIRDPNEVVKLNQKVRVRIVDVDLERKRIQLSMKDVD
jgi:uncharacterized protein